MFEINVYFYSSFCIDKIQTNNVMNFVFVFTVIFFFYLQYMHEYIYKWHKNVLLDPFICVGRQ